VSEQNQGAQGALKEHSSFTRKPHHRTMGHACHKRSHRGTYHLTQGECATALTQPERLVLN